MANQIRFKRASGSDPGASDIAVGEPAVRTDTGELFFKKDDGSVAKISGGGISDGDKGDITVSNSGGTFTIDNDAVTYAKIQNVSATNRILGRDSSGAGVIEEITPANLRTMLNVADGATNVTNTNQLTNGAGFITATLTNEQVQDIVGGMVSGNTETGITVTYQDGDGTLDFVVGTLNQDTTGNAATATALETARNIGGVSFDGTGNINLPGVNTSGDQDTSGNAATATKLATARTIAGVSFDGSANISLNNNAITNGAGYITATLTNEQVQDIVGGMVTGNTESGITVTYQDGDGTLDFSVASQTDNNFTDSDHSKLDGIASGATANTINNNANNRVITGSGTTGTLEGESDLTFNGSQLEITDAKLRISDATPTIDLMDSSTNPDYSISNNNGVFRIRDLTNLTNPLTISSSAMTSHVDFVPSANNNIDLGTSSLRWANLFVNDMHFANSADNPNKVDGTWGDWTLQEGEDSIYMLNNRNGKKYKMNLTEIV